jgi:DNA-binding PadR family transcriptional regulator
MSSRYISVEEINSISAAIEDETGIELLKAIRDNVVSESDIKEQKSFDGQDKEAIKKEQERVSQERSFIGSTKEESIIKGQEDESKRGILKRLEEKGLVQSGGYIPLGKERINSYKLTNEGLVLLAFVEKIKGGSKQAQTQEETPKSKSQVQREERQQEREENRKVYTK